MCAELITGQCQKTFLPILWVLFATTITLLIIPAVQGTQNPKKLSAEVRENAQPFWELSREMRKDSMEDAWDFKERPDMCSYHIQNTKFTDCVVHIGCLSHTQTYKNWPSCYLGGWNHFSDPVAGNFSIMFSEKEGYEGYYGFTNPVIRIEHLMKNRELPISDYYQAVWVAYSNCHRWGWEKCDDEEDPKKYPRVCDVWTSWKGIELQKDNMRYYKTKDWRCGFPRPESPLVEATESHGY